MAEEEKGFMDYVDEGIGALKEGVNYFQGARGGKPVFETKESAPPAPPPQKKPVYIPRPAPAQAPNVQVIAPQPLTESRTVTTQELPQQSWDEATSYGIPQETERAMAEFEAARKDLQESPVYQQGRSGMEEELAFRQQELEKVYSDAEKAFKNMQDPSQFGGYWETKSTGGKILAGLGMAFATVGAGLAGRPQQALQFIDNAIKRDTEAKRDRLNRQLQVIARSKATAETKGKRLLYIQQALDDLDSGKPYAVAIAKAKAMAAKTGKPEHADFVGFMEQAAKASILKKKADYYKETLKPDVFKRREYEPIGEGVPLTRRETVTKDRPYQNAQDLTFKDKWKMTNDLTSMITKPIPRTLKQVAIASNTLLATVRDAMRKRAAGVKNPYSDVFVALQGAKTAQGDTSVVRAPELRIFTGAGSLLTKAENIFNNLRTGQSFSDKQYRQLEQALETYAKFTASAYNQEISPVIMRARAAGLPINDIYSSGGMYFDAATDHDEDRVIWEYRQRKAKK